MKKKQLWLSSLLPSIIVCIILLVCDSVYSLAIIHEPHTGAHSYRELVENGHIFVDKSMLIKDFIDLKAKTALLTLPKHWGKTINSDMLQTFFKMDVDSHGNQLNASETFAHKFFSSELNSTRSKKFKIAGEDVMKTFCGQYPVIVFGFKNLGKSLTFDSIFASMKDAISDVFKAHVFMLSVFDKKEKNESLSHGDHHLNTENKAMFLKYLRKQGTESEIASSLKFLSQILSEAFGRKTFIFIDDYDVVISEVSLSTQVTFTEKESIFRYIQMSLTETFHANAFFEKALITGTLRIRLDLFSKVNLADFNMLNNPFYKHYGFIQPEVDELLNQHKINQNLKETAKIWYGGYNIQRYFLYNSWSISNFIFYKKIENYWEPVQNFENLLWLKSLEPRIIRLLSGELQQVDIYGLTFTTNDLLTLKEMSVENDLKRAEIILFFRLGLSAGYFAVDQKAIRLANKEVSTEINEKLTNHYLNLYNIDPGVERPLKAAFKNLHKQEGVSLFTNALTDLMNHFPKFEGKFQEGGSPCGQWLTKCHSDVIQAAFNTVILLSNTAVEHGSEICLSNRTILDTTTKWLGDIWTTNGSDVGCILGQRPNIVFVVPEVRLGLVIEIRLMSSAEKALEDALVYSKTFENRLEVDAIKLVGIHVWPNKTVSSADFTIKREQKPWLRSLSELRYSPHYRLQ